MIVRIAAEGQFEVPDEQAKELEKLDAALMKAVDGKDEARFRSALQALFTKVRSAGTRLPDDYLGPSDMALPPESASREEVYELLHDKGAVTD